MLPSIECQKGKWFTVCLLADCASMAHIFVGQMACSGTIPHYRMMWLTQHTRKASHRYIALLYAKKMPLATPHFSITHGKIARTLLNTDANLQYQRANKKKTGKRKEKGCNIYGYSFYSWGWLPSRLIYVCYELVGVTNWLIVRKMPADESEGGQITSGTIHSSNIVCENEWFVHEIIS